MLDARKLIASVEECLGWPYVSPGTKDARGIDCSGLFVKAYRDQGAAFITAWDNRAAGTISSFADFPVS